MFTFRPRHFFGAALKSRYRSIVWAAFLGLLLSGLTIPREHQAQTSTDTNSSTAVEPELSENTILKQEITSSLPQTFSLYVKERQYVSVLFTKGDLQLSVNVLDSHGESIIELISRSHEPIRLAFISKRSGVHKLVVRSLEETDELRKYQVKIEAIRTASEGEKKIATAVAAVAEAVKLQLRWDEKSLRNALAKYEEAARLFKSARLSYETSKTLADMGAIHSALSEYKEALNRYLEASRVSQASQNTAGEMRHRAAASLVYISRADYDKARLESSSAFNYFSRRNDPSPEHLRDEALALNSVGEAHYYLGELRVSLDYFSRALTTSRAAGDRAGQALVHRNLGYSHLDSGNLTEAKQHFDESSRLYRLLGDQRGEALALTAFGSVYSLIGEKQKALDVHLGARKVFRMIGDWQSEAVTLNSIGKAYEDLNDLLTALDHYRQALEINQQRGNKEFEAVTRYYLGRAYKSLGKKEEALQHFQESLVQSQRLRQKRVAAYAVCAISAITGAEGNQQRALSQLHRGLQLYEEINDRRGQANALNAIGQIHQSRQAPQRALQFYNRALRLTRKAADRKAETETLYNIARTTSDSGDPQQALKVLEESMELIEGLRSQIDSRELRASYFASVGNHWELYIDLLMKLHWANPDKGFAALAFQASEHARARSLIEMLTEVGASIRHGVNPQILAEERQLQQQLAAKAAYQMRLRSDDSKPDELETAEKEIRELNNSYEEIQTQIRRQSPEFASLVQPQPLTLEQIQAELQDSDTLLEFSLGQERSYLWLVTRTSVTPYQLPSRARIEAAVTDLYKLLTVRQSLDEKAVDKFHASAAESDTLYWEKSSALSQTLLGPFISTLETKRLLIVADGALQYLPFEALPTPRTVNTETSNPSPPLIVNHEVVNLPSASVLASLRRADRSPDTAKGLVAIIADPVFEKDDPRLNSVRHVSTGLRITTERARLFTFGNGDARKEESTVARLPATRQEAEAILAVTPSGSEKLAIDFDACRTTIMNGELADYSVLHFATHGIIDTTHPELSGIMLSMFSRTGQNDNGFLQIHDIYNLNLPNTELVVLSACKTALGKDVKKEGMVGLTRGFMYAGSKSVVASLWKVDDRATTELMKHFYSGMFEERLTPAAALRKAKMAMLAQERWRSPFFWAAFTIQGEYKNQIQLPRGTQPTVNNFLLVVLIIAAVASAILIFAKLRRTY